MKNISIIAAGIILAIVILGFFAKMYISAFKTAWVLQIEKNVTTKDGKLLVGKASDARDRLWSAFLGAAQMLGWISVAVIYFCDKWAGAVMMITGYAYLTLGFVYIFRYIGAKNKLSVNVLLVIIATACVSASFFFAVTSCGDGGTFVKLPSYIANIVGIMAFAVVSSLGLGMIVFISMCMATMESRLQDKMELIVVRVPDDDEDSDDDEAENAES